MFDITKLIDPSKDDSYNIETVKNSVKINLKEYADPLVDNSPLIDVVLCASFSDCLYGAFKEYKDFAHQACADLSEGDYDKYLNTFMECMRSLFNTMSGTSKNAFSIAYYKFCVLVIRDIYLSIVAWNNSEKDPAVELLKIISPSAVSEAKVEYEYWLKKQTSTEIDILKLGSFCAWGVEVEKIPVVIPTFEDVCNLMGVNTEIKRPESLGVKKPTV